MICHAYYGFTLSIASEIILGVNSLDKKIHKYFDGVVVDNKNRKYKYIIPHESFNYFLTLNKSEYVKKCINHLLLNITKGTKNNVKTNDFLNDNKEIQTVLYNNEEGFTKELPNLSSSFFGWKISTISNDNVFNGTEKIKGDNYSIYIIKNEEIIKKREKIEETTSCIYLSLKEWEYVSKIIPQILFIVCFSKKYNSNDNSFPTLEDILNENLHAMFWENDPPAILSDNDSIKFNDIFDFYKDNIKIVQSIFNCDNTEAEKLIKDLCEYKKYGFTRYCFFPSIGFTFGITTDKLIEIGGLEANLKYLKLYCTVETFFTGYDIHGNTCFPDTYLLLSLGVCGQTFGYVFYIDIYNFLSILYEESSEMNLWKFLSIFLHSISRFLGLTINISSNFVILISFDIFQYSIIIIISYQFIRILKADNYGEDESYGEKFNKNKLSTVLI